MALADALEKMRTRSNGQEAWLKENCPYVFADQKHLDANTPERAYWHYGYRAALLDAIKLIRSETPTS